MEGKGKGKALEDLLKVRSLEREGWLLPDGSQSFLK